MLQLCVQLGTGTGAIERLLNKNVQQGTVFCRHIADPVELYWKDQTLQIFDVLFTGAATKLSALNSQVKNDPRYASFHWNSWDWRSRRGEASW